MDLFRRLSALGVGVEPKGRPNQFASKPVDLTFTKGDVARFNRIYLALYHSDLNQIERTESRAIKVSRNNMYAWDIYHDNAGLRITAIMCGFLFVWRLGRPKFNESDISGWKSWRIFEKYCDDFGINLKSMAITDGARIKETIEKPHIRMLLCHTVLDNVHHIDFHSSYASGLALTHPEFRTMIEMMYNERRSHPEFKDVLVCAIGYMQSIKSCKARWAHLAKDAISNNNTRVEALALALELTGRTIVGFNTDGIWYQGDIYHDPRNGEGAGIGQWHNDHVNCKFRAKSDGAYEYIERGVYHPVVRGMTALDRVKDRSEWEWGDIYRTDAEVMKFKFEEGQGVSLVE